LEKLHNILLKFKPYVWLIELSKKTDIPGFDKIPLYTVGSFFFAELGKESILTKASSLAFNFFLAIFPAIIFFFTLIPFVPIDNFQAELLSILEQILPKNAFETTQETLEDIIQNKSGNLLSFGFIFTLFLATNGINTMMGAFNKSSLVFENRSFIKQRLIALFLTVALSLLLLVGVSLITLGEFLLTFLEKEGFITDSITYYLLLFSQWSGIGIIFFISISMLYYFGPATVRRWKFFSAGSTLATLLTILASVLFAFYINNFGTYNKLYGSIGTIIVIMLWIYFNSIILLIGFELNASIDISRHKLTNSTKN
jgi:membrane protein